MFDENHRVYPRDEKGRSTGGPIWRESWVPTVIESETSRSWITKYGDKFPKKRADFERLAYSQEEIDELQWVKEYRADIWRAVQGARDPEVLRQIAALIGWEPPK
jgi:hypothetical protein